MKRSRLGLSRSIAAIACVWLLLAQHAGLAHAVWHALHGSPLQQQNVDGAPGTDSGVSCAFDAVLGQVLGGVASAPPPFFGEAVDGDVVHFSLRGAVLARFTAPLSRGPPALS